LIIGEPTFGKGTVQQVVDFNRHPMAKNMPLGELHMTVAQFFRINGGTTQNAAVSPDVPFPVTVDGDEYGESTYKNALPYTEIAPSMFNRLGSFKNINPQLVERHKQRAANNTEFAWWMQDVNEFKALRANKTLSLNEQERLAERERLKAKRSAREAERKRLGLKSIALDNNDDGLQANERKVSEQIAQENAVKDLPDPLLNESVAILADAIVLLEADKPLLTRVFPQAQSAGVWTE
jgi:carboxyl-terminal processing protease